jgi:hypothetical protein
LHRSNVEQEELSKGCSAPPKMLRNPLDKILEMEEHNYKHRPSDKEVASNSLLDMREDSV